jgi:hypothetical protein
MNKVDLTNTMAIAEISGADSIAAALRYCERNPHVRTLIPTYAHTGTEYGDFGGIEGNLVFLGRELRERHGVELEPLESLEDPALWRALNGRFGSVLAERYGAWVPCVGCHLYLHLMRVLLALRREAPVVISGEREWHGTATKPNQMPRALDAYSAVLAHAGVELALPVRDVAEKSAIDTLLGERWVGGSPQLECVLSGNYRGLEGDGAVKEMPAGFFDEFLVPAGKRLLTALLAGDGDYDAIVADVLREARA